MPIRKRRATPPDRPVIRCRACAPPDCDPIATIWLEGWRSNGIRLPSEPSFPILRARIEREIAGTWQVIVAESADEIVGFVALNPEAAVLEQLFVAPAWHRRGIGALLLAEARRWMPHGFTLWTHDDNIGAAAFYREQGMAMISKGTHPELGHAIATFAFAPIS